jgi:tRNA (guanine-N7-)-methyltransferase
MHSNSRFITSNQTGIHDQLHGLINRRAASDYLKPIAPSSQLAFNTALNAWRVTHKTEVIIDAGCGVGLSTRRLAALHPNHFVIGIDQSSDRLSRQIEWPEVAQDNFITVRADLVDFWRLLHDAAIYPSHHYLLYPNPWPKKNHLARRWHAHPAFPTVIALGGYIECRSNWKIYVEEFAAAATLMSGISTHCENFSPNSAPLTPFEEKYLASGHELWRCRLNLPAVGSNRMTSKFSC